jgi:hypothetical protein
MIAAAGVCDPLNGDLTGCNPADLLGGIAGGVASSAWESVCRSFADAAVALLKQFAVAFVAFPNLDLSSGGISAVYGISLWLAGIVAALLLIGQVIRTAVTSDGSAIAHGLVGLGKAALAFTLTLTVGQVALRAADELTVGIINGSFGSTKGLQDKLSAVFQMSGTSSASLMLILALVGIALVLVLWFELLLRNAALAVLIATSPVGAAGQVSEVTRGWWSKLLAASVQLVVLKPLIALVFAVGLKLTFDSGVSATAPDIATVLSGMVVLLLAVVAWPAVARFFTFATVSAGAGAGLGALLGFAAGRAGSGGGGPVGVNPAMFSQAAEARTMSGVSTAAVGESGAAAGSSAGAGAAGAGGLAAAGAIAGPLVVAAAGVDLAQRAVNSLTGRMEQMAGHAGIDGANPYARPAGHPQYRGGWFGSGSRTPASTSGADAPAASSAGPQAGAAGSMPMPEFTPVQPPAASIPSSPVVEQLPGSSTAGPHGRGPIEEV